MGTPGRSREVVVTACGVVSPIGNSAAEFETNLFAGKSGVRNIRGGIVPPDFPVPYAAWIPRENLARSELHPDRDPSEFLKSWLMTEQVVAQALDQSGDPSDERNAVDAILYGTADGVTYELSERVLRHSLPREFDFNAIRSESPLLAIRALLEKRGHRPIADPEMISLNSACATGNQTLGLALQGIRSGRWTRCLVGGVDARCEPSNLLNFYLLGALTTDDIAPEKASRPFSKDRSGFVRGEGAAAFILETREAAEARGARILGTISGYACTSDAYRLTDGRDDGASVIEAMRAAIENAGLTPELIDYVNAHGTSTPLNDRLETLAIKAVFGARAKQLPVSSVKSQIGHSTIAASAIEALACLLMLKNQRLSPTINYHHPDPECDLDYVPNESRAARVEHILSNSFGFGGQNTCLVISRTHP